MSDSDKPNDAKMPPNDGEPVAQQQHQTAIPPVRAFVSQKTFFGVRKEDSAPQTTVFNDDYEKRFPQDPYCKETAPNARIWRTYNEEAAAYDAEMVGQSRDGVDVMLVFAGLFSAVVTSFLLQASQNLQADYSEMSALLLYDLVFVQLSMASGNISSLTNITLPSINPAEAFRPDSNAVWVNGLWVVSLTASLIVALAAVLVKQWLHHYTSTPSGTPGTRSHVRQYRFMGLQTWRVSVIIGLLPLIMHASLALFLAGLILFFIPLRTSLAWAVGVLTVIVCVLYLVSNAMPIFFSQCPYQTPLTDFVCYGFRMSNRLYGYFFHDRLPDHSASPNMKGQSMTLKEMETKAVASAAQKLSVDSLDWLFNVSSNPNVHSLVVQAIGGLPSGIQQYACALWQNHNHMQRVRDHLFTRSGEISVGPYLPWVSLRCRSDEESVLCERLSRSFFFLPQDRDSLSERFWIQDDNFSDPRFIASIWSTGRRDQVHAAQLRKFLCSSHNLKLHRLVWVKIVELARDNGVFTLADHDNMSMYACLISLLLPAAGIDSTRMEIQRDVQLQRDIVMTLREATCSHLTDIWFQNVLLTLLVSFDDPLSSPYSSPTHRLVLKAGKFALLGINKELFAQQRSPDGVHHLTLLDEVLGNLRDFLKDYSSSGLRIHPKHREFVAAIFDFVVAVIDRSPICDFIPEGGEDERVCSRLNRCFYNTTSLSSWFLLSDEFTLPPFHRLLPLPAHHLNHNLGMWREDWPPYLPESTVSVLGMMSLLLTHGDEEVYRTFVDGEWLGILAGSWVVLISGVYLKSGSSGWSCVKTGQASTLYRYIIGLAAVESESARHDFLEYIHEPRNLVLAFIMLATDVSVARLVYNPDDLPTSALLRLCPEHPSWPECRATLKGILHWCQGDSQDEVPFPLDNLFDGRVVHVADFVISLDVELRKIFLQRRVWLSLEAAVRDLNADPPSSPVASNVEDWIP